MVCELLRANLYEFQKHNRDSGDPPYFTPPRVLSIARQVGAGRRGFRAARPRRGALHWGAQPTPAGAWAEIEMGLGCLCVSFPPPYVSLSEASRSEAQSAFILRPQRGQ